MNPIDKARDAWEKTDFNAQPIPREAFIAGYTAVLSQCEQEPVGWRWTFDGVNWFFGREQPEEFRFGQPTAIEPVFTHPTDVRAQAIRECAAVALRTSEDGEYHGETSVNSSSSIYQQGAFEVYETILSLLKEPS